ncbi:MAG: hypothetical protein IPI31_00120 [Bacteroidetes bacterium]|nr:hypothetical protein [Bacteroidota bacterium]
MKKISFQYDQSLQNNFKALWTKYETEKVDNNFELLKTYLKTINTFSATDNSNEEVKNEKPEDILRFNVYTHFLQRYVIGCYDKKYLETTCRGLIAFPIQSNKENDEIKSKIPNVGYFYGIIKDSDNDGNCYGNYYSKRKSTLNKKKDVANFYNEQLYQLQSIAFNLGRIETQNIYYRGILEKHRKETEQQATRAAISQVMARNMSHNIGSHVLNRLTDGDYLMKLKVGKFKSYQPQPSITIEYKDLKPFQQIAIYNNYVKCRMDYLSDITFGTPLMHTHKKAFNEIYRDFDRVRLLLEFISGLSEFKYEIKFTKQNSKGEIVPLTVNDDLTLALPNDVLGCQAFYNILENIIRNTAKHNQRKRKTTVFTINFKEINLSSADVNLNEAKSIFYEVEVYDDIEIKGNKRFVSKEDEEQKTIYCKKVEANKRKSISNIDWLIYCQNEKINLSVLKDNNQLRNSSLGLLEMEASAAYLRKLDIIQIEADEYEVNHDEKIFNSNNNLNILKAFSKDGCLAYRFFISKPTEFLFVGEFGINETETLAKEGIWVMTEKQFTCELKKDVVFNHQFVLHQGSNTINEILKEYKTNLPIRVLEIELNSPVIDKLKANFSFSKVEEWIWEEWFNIIRCNFENVNVFKVFSNTNESHTQPNSYNIALSHHGENLVDCKNDFVSGNIQSFDVLSTNAKSKLPDAQEDFVTYLDEIKNQFVPKAKLFEAAINSVVVIDERIQRYSKETYMKILNKEIFAYTNIQIPYDIDLAKENFTDELTDRIENFISASISLCQNKFLIIHYSILERMYGGNDNRKEKIESKLIEWSEHIRVVVTSGRGKPPELPSNNICYVNLSPVLNAFTHARSKYAINYLLNTARK